MSTLRSTADCEQMNAVYDALKQANPAELNALFQESVLQATLGSDSAALFAYQIRIEVQNRLKGNQ